MLKVIHQETMCCGYKKCPVIQIFEDGSLKVSDDDADSDSVGTVRFRPEAASRFLQMLSEKLPSK